MTTTHSLSESLDYRAIIDGLGQGVLIFDADNHLVLDNVAARAILGANLVLVRAEGWRAAAMLLDAASEDRPGADDLRAKALRQAEPVRFHTYLNGTYTPCWAAAIYGPGGAIYTMITLERPDWSALTDLMGTFREEAGESISSTRGHAELIRQVIRRRTPATTADQLAKQVGGFADLMSVEMYRLARLMDQLQRLEAIRTGQLGKLIRTNRKAIDLAGFVEDFLEDINETPLVERPDSSIDYRDRIRVDVPDEITVSASVQHLTYAFHDILRNSVMYSPPDTPITIRAVPAPKTRSVQLDIIDEGYGIRETETTRVFAPFQRARQPQVIAEVGYGLSLYLVKMEIEEMGGKIWFSSEEKVGTTFSLKLLLWRAS